MVCVYVCVCVAEWFPHCLESEVSVGVRHGVCICVCVSVSVSVYDEVRDIDRPCCSMGYGAAWFYHCLESGECGSQAWCVCLCLCVCVCV